MIVAVIVSQVSAFPREADRPRRGGGRGSGNRNVVPAPGPPLREKGPPFFGDFLHENL